MKFIKYKHHDVEVWVREDLQGKHREYCLCYSCKKFDPTDREKNCKIANFLFNTCVVNDLVIPVWECKVFCNIDNKE